MNFNFDPVITGKKLRALRKQMNLNQSEFIEKFNLDVSQGALSAWETGTRTIDMVALLKIAHAASVSLDWLLDASGTYESEPKITDLTNYVSEELTPYHFTKVPIISKVQGGDPKLIYREDNIDGHALLPEGIVADYALVVEGDSMYNPSALVSIAPGDTVYCSTIETPLIGDVVVILTTEGRQMCKQFYKLLNNEKIEFRSFNTAYQPMVFSSEQIEVMHRVVYHQPLGKKL